MEQHLIDPLDTAAQLLEAAAYVLDRQLELEAGQPLAVEDVRRVLSIARRALLRIPLPPMEADDRPVPAWLIAQREDWDARQ